MPPAQAAPAAPTETLRLDTVTMNTVLKNMKYGQQEVEATFWGFLSPFSGFFDPSNRTWGRFLGIIFHILVFLWIFLDVDMPNRFGWALVFYLYATFLMIKYVVGAYTGNEIWIQRNMPQLL